jgi:DNA-binding NarL/FixJ family response regulator
VLESVSRFTDDIKIVTYAQELIDSLDEGRLVFLYHRFAFDGTEELVRYLCKKRRDARIVVWACDEVSAAAEARFIGLGAESFLELWRGEDEVNREFAAAFNGVPVYSPEVERIMERGVSCGEGLSHREAEVLRYLVKCKPNKQIAAEMGISVPTVKTHKAHIYEKIGGSNVWDVLQYAVSRSYFDVNEISMNRGGGDDFEE